MAPNHVHGSQSCSKPTPSKRYHDHNTFVSHSNHHSTDNNQNQSAAFDIETFSIVEFVIFSLLGRPTNGETSSNRVAVRFREMVSEILEKHGVYNCLCANLDVSPSTLEPNFIGVAESTFDDGHINWGRMVALVAFSVKVAEYFRSQGYGNHDGVIVELTSDFLVRRTGNWIRAQGGWGHLVTHFAETGSTNGHFSLQNDSWYKGILVTATATLGLGALLAVTCR